MQGIQLNRELSDTPHKAKEIDIGAVIQAVTEVFNVN
jgi:hypothetical protein